MGMSDGVLPISRAQVTQASGSDTINKSGGQSGHQTLAEELSRLLPKSIDKLRPGGSVPQA